jgi:two-component SAPR family response regulator
MPIAQLHGLCILVVEDDPLVGMLIEDILLDNGCRVCGPYITFAAAMEAAKSETVDLAILDVNLGGTYSYPIAEALAVLKVPFLLTSGYGEGAAPPGHPEWPTYGKPFTPDGLETALASLLVKSAAT